MLPYWYFPQFHSGPIAINTWGFFVSLGFAVAILVAYRRARRFGLDGNRILDLAFWIIVAAIIGARLGHVFFYDWHYYSQHLREIVRVDQGGLSSYGGFIGAALGFWWYMSRNKLNIWQYADVLMFAWPLGHGIGRIGCFFTHMHPGRLSNAAWAVQYPGGARLDMGLLEAIYHFLMFGVVFLLSRKSRHRGFYVLFTMTVYGVIRFVLDFLRATDIPFSDVRYFGLTPAQYGSIALIICGAYFWRRFAIRRLA